MLVQPECGLFIHLTCVKCLLPVTLVVGRGAAPRAAVHRLGGDVHRAGRRPPRRAAGTAGGALQARPPHTLAHRAGALRRVRLHAGKAWHILLATS